MQQKLSELTREREVDAQKHLESISNFEKKLEAMMDEKEKNNVYIGDLESRLETIMNEKSEKVEELLQFKGQVSDMKLENDKKDHQLNELLLQNELVMQEFQETKKELQEERQLKVEFKELYEKSLLTNTELRNRLYVSEHAVVGVVSVATQAHVETGNFQNQTMVDSKDVPCQTLENIELSTFSSGYTIDPIVKVDAGLQTTEPLTITRELQTSIKTRESSSQYDIVTKEVDTQADVDYTDLRCLDVSMVQNEEMERLYDSVQEWSRSIQLFEKDNVKKVDIRYR
jgi:hypothetical protein